jgi:hypothetical protein
MLLPNKVLNRGVLGLFICMLSLCVLCLLAPNSAEADPPADQSYIGSKKCSSCHFDQFLKWRGTKHAKAFDLLPAKYQADAKCLKCHTTGFGEETGFKDPTTTAGLLSVSCESCHGPGSKHEEIAKPFAQKKLSPEEEAMVRGSIWKMLPKNVCVECHKVQGHHDSETPPELRKTK